MSQKLGAWPQRAGMSERGEKAAGQELELE